MLTSPNYTFLFYASDLMAKSLGDPFDGNKLQNPEWKWKNKRIEGEEPEKLDVGKLRKIGFT